MKTFRRTALATAIAGSLLSGNALAVNLATDGIGEVAIAPYYTVRDGWSTLINLTNTVDTPIVVKVRIHEGLNSRDVLDFNIALSGFDVFTAVMEERGGEVTLRSTDTANDDGRYTCTIPSGVALADVGSAPNWIHTLNGPPDIPVDSPLFDPVNLQFGGYRNPPGVPTSNDGWRVGDDDRLFEGYIEFIVMGYFEGSKTGPLQGGTYNDGDPDASPPVAPTPIPADAINVGNAIEQHRCDLLDLAFDDKPSPTGESHILETARQAGEPINALKFNFRLLNAGRGIEAGNNATTWANFFNPLTGEDEDVPPGLVPDPPVPGEEFIFNPVALNFFLARPVSNAECTITRGDERRSSSDANPPNEDRADKGAAGNWNPGDTNPTGSCQNLITAQRPFAFLEPSLNDAYPPVAHYYDDSWDSYVFTIPVNLNNDPVDVGAGFAFGGVRGVDAFSATIQRSTIVNEWSNNDQLGVTTDWIVTQPTKGFYVDRGVGGLDTVDGQQSAITDDRLEAQLWDNSGTRGDLAAALPVPYEPYQSPWLKVNNTTGACNNVSFVYYDRAEQTPEPDEGGVIISPAPPITVEPEDLCFETTVVYFNGQSALSDVPPNRIDIDTSPLAGAKNGWMFLKLDDFDGARLPLQVIPFAFNSPAAGIIASANNLRGLPVTGFNLKVRTFGDVTKNYASSLDHAYTRTYSQSSEPPQPPTGP